MTHSAGFTMLEVLVAVSILSIGALAMGSALEQARFAAADDARAAIADHLLEDGLAYARSLPRLDPDAPRFGAEAAELVVDDVDDLDERVEPGPVDLAGVPHDARWTRRFTVQSVGVDDPTKILADGTGPLLRVTVTVALDGAELRTASLLLARTP
ncbi:MAG: prepilin-type N-terminal cleavage/methylation domain-containing protein [Planctomycetes bacterium]|nr:prepilin-type N-terminal cleavage/methylation domain-containing protein [Planctomycetota bacterium]